MLSKLFILANKVVSMTGATERANRVSPVLSSPWERELGVGQSWIPLSYGEYYPRSAPVYSAIKIRQDAIARVPLKVYRGRRERMGYGVEDTRYGVRESAAVSGETLGLRTRDRLEAVEAVHPVQKLLDRPNPFWTRGDLWRAPETYLNLWSSAFWGLERDDLGRVVEIWPLRSDRVRVIPDPQWYVKGFMFVGQGRRLVSYVPEDIVWMRYFNPLDEYAGMSPMAPLRLSADMGLDALRASRSGLTNESAPGLSGAEGPGV